ncbi:MAG: ligase-associated DNA damage response endonuclease PdeM [Bacteroidota bacterium]
MLSVEEAFLISSHKKKLHHKILKQITIHIANQELTLLPNKALLLKKHRTLVISDLHIGKAGHFRKFGIPISKAIHQDDIKLLTKLVRNLQIKRLLIIGDLFHSEFNREWELLVQFLEVHPQLETILVAGNHDRYTKTIMEKHLTVYEQAYEIDKLVFTHEPLLKETININMYNICGHIHPAVRLNGSGSQTIKLPCFYFGKNQGILPAFGKFTGSALIQPTTQDKIYVIAGEKVMQVL